MNMRNVHRRALSIVSMGIATGLLVLGSSASPALADTARPGDQGRVRAATVEKSARWAVLHSGDCEQDNGTIVIHPDGTGDWSATTLTYQTHSGDIWHASFRFYTTSGTYLFSAGTFNSPRMSDGNPPPHYNWGAHFSFDPDLYYATNVLKTTQTYSC